MTEDLDFKLKLSANSQCLVAIVLDGAALEPLSRRDCGDQRPLPHFTEDEDTAGALEREKGV